MPVGVYLNFVLVLSVFEPVVFFIFRELTVLPSKILLQIVDSIVSHGSFLTNCFIEHSVVGIRSRINSNVHLKVRSRSMHNSIPDPEYLRTTTNLF